MPSPRREDTPLQQLGATIRHYRRQRYLTQRALAAQAGIDHMSLSQIERGRQNVTILNLFYIARALEIPLSHLIQPLDDLCLPSAPFPTDHSP